MLLKRNDQLGKNVFRDLLVMSGEARVEEEIPPMDAMRIDLWYVPDELKRRAAPLGGLVAEISSQPAVLEIWSDAFDARDFEDAHYKRHGWIRVLESRDKRPWTTPMLWHVCAGKPSTVIEEFSLLPLTGGLSGCYEALGNGWRVRIVVISELPTNRETVLLRLLGSPRIRAQAIRDLQALPHDAWERRLAQPWLSRLFLDLPNPLTLDDRERTEFAMEDYRAWHAEYERNLKAQYRLELEPELKRTLEPELKRTLEPEIADKVLLRDRLHLFQCRLGRALSTAECDTLAARTRELGPERVGEFLLKSSDADLIAWLAGQ